MQPALPRDLAAVLSQHDHIAVAVSGGADSMALAHMLAHAAPPSTSIHAVTVDHGLRHDSAAEAAQVAQWLAHWPATRHRILRWEGEKPETGRLEAARTARYDLLAGYCAAHGISLLALAHHRDDQAETVLFRLAKGSGTDGLAGMRVFAPAQSGVVPNSVVLWRPLLDMSHDDLVSYCRGHAVPWVEDPSNGDDRYARVRLRKAREILAAEGLTSTRLAMTAARIARAQDALDWASAHFARHIVLSRTSEGVTLSMHGLRELPFDLGLRIVREAAVSLRPSAYGPRLAKLESVLAGLLEAPRDSRATLAGCLFEYDHSHAIMKVRPEKEAD